jgi:hypothetical protein
VGSTLDIAVVGGDVAATLAAYDAERIRRTTKLVPGSSSVEGDLGGDDFLTWIYGYDAAAAGSRQARPL